ncbi:helix-turn-helix transcriptional regulator [Streptococcus salivarius]|uniref:helix-turn-helix transcriptional regulator n=1 Tax=Streptococcus salivarius TaxID=1304 RepID=UPI000535E914|nr:helix-turn-helix transcriptional regulator [Streptococcus salivarius]MBS5746194.1 helix-turn-helix transcriptional regulator [Streptococcus sp.]AIY20492.1 transcriptional regulator [Streptococcus salivarius]AMB82095.1 transcriptional regulator [Streptococcus salivarius]ARI57930.1 transcriptional regulator [Streptococcus salivarius]MCP9062546.1 helix-turn-helix transcriptional regulator [Streptococcus salivarius]
MNIKDSIGLRIKTERERQQMSREVLCLDGAELTVRQLIRIEKGESLPSLDKLSYIAKRLGKNMSDLLDHDNITIPDEYYEMKNRLIKFPTYRNPERIKSKLALIEEVYEKFFELLPEEELLTLDILENILSFTNWEESPKVEEIYEDLFEQVKRKKKFSTNDLLVIDYYFFHLYGRKQFDKKLFERIVKRVLNQEIWTDDVYNIVLFNDLMAIAALKIFHNSFSDFLTVVDKALAVIEKSQFYSYKPSVFVLKAKYELLHKGNKKKAAENYDKAIMFASVLEDSVLEESIKAGKAADGL